MALGQTFSRFKKHFGSESLKAPATLGITVIRLVPITEKQRPCRLDTIVFPPFMKIILFLFARMIFGPYPKMVE